METIPWFWVWVVLAAALSVGEMLTTSFFMLPFALGAAVAALIEAFGGDLVWQWVVFTVVSVVALILFRPLARRITPTTTQKSGVDRLIGMSGKVIEGSPSPKKVALVLVPKSGTLSPRMVDVRRSTVR